MPNEVKLLPCDQMRLKLIDWLNAFKADPFSTGADKVDRLLEITRPTTLVTDEVVERVKAALFKAVDDGLAPDLHRQDMGNESLDALARAALASMPTVVTGEQPLQSVGDHALPPSGLSQSSLSQAKPAAAIARKEVK